MELLKNDVKRSVSKVWGALHRKEKRKDMRQALGKGIILGGMVLLVCISSPRGSVVAMAPERVYVSSADVELMTLAVKADVAEISSEVTESVDIVEKSYRQWNNLQRERAVQERLRNLAETRRIEEEERREQERLRKIEEARRKKEEKLQKRRKAIRKYCGRVKGTEAETILERIVEAEAGGEDRKGRILVANVVLNRVMDEEFPDSIRGVVFQHSGNRYQFSPVSNGAYYSVHVSKGTKKAVQAALKGEDPSQGALYFMERALAESGNVKWFDNALTKLQYHGCHEFYK